MIRKAFMLGAVIAAMAAGAGGEELFIPADGSVVTSASLAAGWSYIIEARGTYGYRDVVPAKIADAEWAFSPLDGAWVEIPPEGDLDLYVDGVDISMMGTVDGVVFSHHVFSPGHIYRATVFGEGAPVELSIYDERCDDNSGGLEATIRLAVMGDTNADDVVDGRDYDNLVAQFGGLPGAESADFNGDGIVDLCDFAIQRANFDLGLGVASAPAGESGATTPEPATLIFLGGGLPLLLKRKRKSRYG